MNYFEALLYMAERILMNTHTAVQVGRASEGHRLYSIEFEDCEYKDDKDDVCLHSGRVFGKTLEEAAEGYYNRIKDKLLVFHAFSKTRYEVPTNELIESWEEFRKKEEEEKTVATE